MARAPFQVLIIPYIIEEEEIKYGIFKRSDRVVWQFISGGGEGNEIPIEAAIRERFEEAKIAKDIKIFKLDAVATVPAEIFCEAYRKNWGENCYVIPEYAFAFELGNNKIEISEEHLEYKFVSYDEAKKLLKYDSNRTAMTELRARILKKDLY